MKIHNKGQARLFKNPYLELLTKANPLIIWGMYLPAIAYLLWYSHDTLQFSLLKIFLLFTGAIFCWTLFEYIAHRYVFHWISDEPRMRRFAYVLHGNHHEYPRDRQRLFMPPVPSLLIVSVLFTLCYLAMRENAFVFFPGFVFGYLLYASMHYAIHAWAPPFKWMKPLWRNHHLHHYKNEELGFGVSSTLWDWVFQTRFDLKKEKEDPQKVRDLLFERKQKIS
ncbi:fatty acid hydroxylase family protein [Anseongella ginsenosidimutans]|uniref:Fatty acid hydroxylase family protein n=1 Tax=Anseongella ginsenosidimutans TaxID=496056 RepID=A0A4R3KR63_9SPHI|nr:sterol desaturase family protein [Anseongella ginsenosidimutans]QEC53016.1 fatty acid hydroxylase [Anseongella ginsenosidimutans]TCS87422.1 fatty acid hydroxylase family protein [Anseongella ginsenosidimutans]